MTSNYLKKIWIALFTNNPYKIKWFKDIYAETIGVAADRPESLSGIIKHETGEPIKYTLPVITYNQEINYRQLGKNDRFALSGVFKSPDRVVYSISNARIIGQIGLVYDPAKRAFINESAKDWVTNLKKSSYLNAINLPQIQRLKGTTLSFLTIGADGGFYHFLFESIIKSAMYQSLLTYAEHLLLNGPCADWKLKWIYKANIDTSKIIWANSTSHYECEQLIFTNKLIGDQQVNSWCVDSLKSLFNIESVISSTKKVLWISRKGLHDRDIAWEAKILASYPEMESVDLSQLSADETTSKFQHATHIVAPHGAGLSNIYLCRPGTKVLEICPDGAYFQPCYFRLSSICGLEHSLLYLDFKDDKNTAKGFDTLTAVLTTLLC